MHYSYDTKGVCSTKIEFDIENGKIYNVSYQSGCSGNLKAISRLVDGMDADNVIKTLRGLQCGFKSTSCSDQLARAVSEAIGSSAN